jgi:hypothetical protein
LALQLLLSLSTHSTYRQNTLHWSPFSSSLAQLKLPAKREVSAAEVRNCAKGLLASDRFHDLLDDAQELLEDLFKADWVIAKWTHIRDEARSDLSKLAHAPDADVVAAVAATCIKEFMNDERQTDARRFAEYSRRLVAKSARANKRARAKV